MNEEEIAKLIRFVHALCPAQKMDEFTPDAWELVLDNVTFDDAKNALKTLGQTLRFIAPSDIAQEVRRVRATRPSFPPGTGPEALEAEIAAVDGPEDLAGYLRALRAERRRVSGPPVAIAVVVERMFVHVASAWSRSAVAPLRAIEAPGAHPEYEAACATLRTLPPHKAQDCLNAARERLETDGTLLDHYAVAILAAELATQPQPSAA